MHDKCIRVFLFYGRGIMKQRKYFNMVLPVEVYRELKKAAYESGQSMGGLMRQGIDIVLKNSKRSEGAGN